MTTRPKARATKKHKILLIDDHPMMRHGLAQLIEHEPDLQVCAEADDARQGLEMIRLHKPTLVISDITLPDKSGLDLIKDIQVLHPECLVLVISMHDETLYVERVLRAGARGYIMKQEGGKKMMEGIRQVLNGQIFVSGKMSAKILESFSGRKAEETASPIEKLTDREFEVLQLVGSGSSTREIAARLRLSTKTVEVHRTNIKQKLHMKSSLEVIRFAIRWVESGASKAAAKNIS